MRFIIAALLALSAQQAYSGCESSIVEGSHSAPVLTEAQTGAWEDAKEVCYPGEAVAMDRVCDRVTGSLGIQGQPAHRCRQTASCTLCGDDLARKYEALD